MFILILILFTVFYIDFNDIWPFFLLFLCYKLLCNIVIYVCRYLMLVLKKIFLTFHFIAAGVHQSLNLYLHHVVSLSKHLYSTLICLKGDV